MLSENDYDAVLADIHLRTAQPWDSYACHQPSPASVVMLSTDEPDIANLRAMMKMKVNYLFFKPIDLGELRSTLARMIRGAPAPWQLPADFPSAPPRS